MGITDFAKRLKELREAAGLTQKELAEKATVGQRTVSHLEQGAQTPSWATVMKLAEALGIDSTAFLQPPKTRRKPRRGRPKSRD
jgi:putative transcriptional regulator